jgi:outer membrane immunogenic protein
LRGRVGFDPPRSLFYITGGLAIGAVRANVGTFPGSSATNVGWAAGAGAEFALSTNLTGKLEFLHVDLGSGHCTPATCGGNATIPLQFELLRAGLNYHFNWAGR